MDSMDNTQETDYSSDCEGGTGTKTKAGGSVKTRLQEILNAGSLNLPTIPQASADLVNSAARLELEAISLKSEIELIMRKVLKSHDAGSVKDTMSQLLAKLNSAPEDTKLQKQLAQILDVLLSNALIILKVDAAMEEKTLVSKDQFQQQESRLNTLVARSTTNTAVYESLIGKLLTAVDKLASNLDHREGESHACDLSELSTKFDVMDNRVSAIQQTISTTMRSVDRTVSQMNEILDRFANSTACQRGPEPTIGSTQEENMVLVKECMTLILPRILGIEHAVLHACNILNSSSISETAAEGQPPDSSIKTNNRIPKRKRRKY